MKSLLKRYNFCAFHKDTQHFFVPNGTNEIIIYDLRTAMRWKSLKGHSGLIECLVVQDSGQVLASFSSADKEIKLWKVEHVYSTDRCNRFFGKFVQKQHRALQDSEDQRRNSSRS